MIALFIVGAAVLLIVFLLSRFVSVEVTYENDKFDYKLRYMFFTLFSEPESTRHKRKREKREARAERKEKKELLKQRRAAEKAHKKHDNKQKSGENGPEAAAAEKPKSAPQKEKTKKTKIDFDFEMIKRLLSAASPHIKRIFRKIRVFDVYFDIVVGGEDAAKTALGYGKMNMLINGLLCFLDSVIMLKVGEVNIEADFDKEKTDFFAHAKMKLRLSTLLHSAIWGYFAVLKEMKRSGSDKAATDAKNRKAA